jgi:hypothetical protein
VAAVGCLHDMPPYATVCVRTSQQCLGRPAGYPGGVLPYASYLRVYEPLHALPAEVRQSLTQAGIARSDSSATLAAEQQVVLRRTVTSASIGIRPTRASDVYVLERDGRRYVCPVDMPLRSWLSMTSLIDSIGGAAARAIVPAESLALADQQFLRWRRDNPRAVPHIRQVTWGVPRTWFTLVVDDERVTYQLGAADSLRYRARVRDARARAARALRTLRASVDDSDLLEELAGLGSWLAAFHSDSWVEVDYAGVAKLLGTSLADDHSARDIHRALEAIGRGDLAAALAAYRAFEERWRLVNAFERAN